MRYKQRAGKPAEKGRPLWGYCRVKAHTICRLWLGFRQGIVQRWDVQTYFALQELMMRRCTLAPGRRAAYSVKELESLTALSAAKLHGCIARLEHAGLVSWSEHAIRMKEGAIGTLEDLAGLSAMLSTVTNHRRTVPIPRHTVLLLARTRRPVLLATLFGHLLRGMYYRSGECLSWGTCKASWIAQAFGVDARNVKAARQELERLGWMRSLESLHWHRQRYGGSFAIALAWDSRVHLTAAANAGPISPPRMQRIRAKSPPPESYRNLLKEHNHQNRAGAVAMVFQNEPRSRRSSLASVISCPLTLAMASEWPSCSARRTPLASCRPASPSGSDSSPPPSAPRRIARNPGGLFLWLVRKRLWRYASDADEQAARQQLSGMPEFYYGSSAPPAAARKAPPSPIPILAKKEYPRKCRDRPKRADPAESDSSHIRELIRQSLASACLTQTSPSHLMLDRISGGAPRGQEENVAQRPAGRRPPHFVLEAVELRP